jgi:hypothetical protein
MFRVGSACTEERSCVERHCRIVLQVSFHWQSHAFQPIFTIAVVMLRRSPSCTFKTSPDIHGPAHAFRVVRGYSDAGVLCARGSQPMVCSWLRRRMRSGVDLRISPGRLALRTGGGYLVFCRVAPVVAANGLSSSTRGELNNLFKMTHARRATV